MYVRELDLFVTVMLLEDTPAVLSLGKLCEDHGYNYHWTSGQNPHPARTARKYIATHQIMHHSSYLVYPRVPLPATRRSEEASEDSSARGNSWHESTNIENPNKDDDKETQMSCKVCRIGYRSSSMDWLMKVCSRTSRYLRAASKSGIGKAEHFYSLPEEPKLRHPLDNPK